MNKLLLIKGKTRKYKETRPFPISGVVGSGRTRRRVKRPRPSARRTGGGFGDSVRRTETFGEGRLFTLGILYSPRRVNYSVRRDFDLRLFPAYKRIFCGFVQHRPAQKENNAAE